MRFLKTTLFLLGIWSPTLCSAEPDVATADVPASFWPDTLIMPWETLNIDSDARRLASKALIQSQEALARTIVGTPVSLNQIAPPPARTDINARAMLSSILSGNRNDRPLSVIPAWAQIQGHQILMLIIVDSHSNILLSFSHRVLRKESWRSLTKDPTALAATISTTMIAMWNELKTNGLPTPNPDLAIGLGTTTVSSRRDEVERNTLNLLLATQQLKSLDATIVNPLALEALMMIHRAWGAEGLLRRPNRHLAISWVYEDNIHQQKFPQKLSLQILPSEAVFAKALPWQIKESATVDLTTDNQLAITISPKLTTQLADEQKALNRSENPLAAKIYGAWVYLDKGRAWGLKMNDRLVVAHGEKMIKGHIVGYFGPEHKLKSPRGWYIHEGAIMFVRKGQTDAKVGTEFLYDPMKVPVPWPPSNTTVK